MWLKNCEVDLDYHVRRVQVPPPGGRRELKQIIGEVASTPLDRGRPLWEFHFAEGMANHRFALIGKVRPPPWLTGWRPQISWLKPSNGTCRRKTNATMTRLAYCRRRPRCYERPSACAGEQVAALPGVIADTLAGFWRLRRRSRERGNQPDLARLLHAPPTFINHVVSPVRTFATATLSLAQVKETSKCLQITINDLVMAMAAGALRELLFRFLGRANWPISHSSTG